MPDVHRIAYPIIVTAYSRPPPARASARRGLPRTGAGFFRTRVGRAPSAAPHDAIPFVTTVSVVPSARRKPASPRCAPQVSKPGAVGRGLLSLAPTLAAPPPGPAFSPFRNHVRRVPTSSPPNVVSAVGSASVTGASRTPRSGTLRVTLCHRWRSSRSPGSLSSRGFRGSRTRCADANLECLKSDLYALILWLSISCDLRRGSQGVAVQVKLRAARAVPSGSAKFIEKSLTKTAKKACVGSCPSDEKRS